MSADAGTRGSESRANLGDEFPWSMAVNSVWEEGGERRWSHVQKGVVRQRP